MELFDSQVVVAVFQKVLFCAASNAQLKLK